MREPTSDDAHPRGSRAAAVTRWRRIVAAVVLAGLPVLGVASPAAAVVPAITSVSPVVGVPGVSVRITGTGFATTPAGNTVTFGAVRATVTAASATSLTVTAPSPRVSSKIRVRTAGGLSGSRDFFMPPSPYTASQVASRLRTAIGGAGASIANPSATHISLVLFDATAGQRFAVDMTGSSIQNPQVRLYRPEGSIVRSISNWPEPNVFLDTVVAPVTGTYSVAVDGRTAGGATVAIRSVPPDSTGTITRGVAQTVTTTAAGQNAVRTFSGTAGQRVALEFSNLALTGDYLSARLLFVHPNGSKLGTERSLSMRGAQAGLVETVTLPVTGTYRVKFDPEFKAVGSVRLLLHAVPADSTGTVTVGTPFTVSTTVGQNASRSFAGTAGQRLVVDATSITYPQQGAAVAVLRPDGTVVNERGFFPPTGFMDEVTLDATGTHRVRIDPVQALSGSMTIVLRNVPPDSTGTVVVGTPQTVTTTAIGQNAVRTFTATAGQRFALEISDATYRVQVTVPQASHDTNIEPNLRDGVSRGPGDDPYWSDVFLAPTSGTYRIEFNGFERQFGSVRMVLRSVPPDNSGTLTPGTPSPIVTTVPGQNARRTFTASVGQRIGIQFTGNTFGNAHLQLISPSGRHLLSEEALFLEGPQGVGVVAAETGTYTLTVDPLDQDTGRVDALLYFQPPDSTGTITIGGPPQTISLRDGQDATRTFDGVAGQRVLVRITANTFPWETHVGIATDEFLTGVWLATGATGEFTADLTSTRPYDLTVRPSFAATGSATVQVLLAPPG